LLRRKSRPTADDYITLNWGTLPQELDEEDIEIIELLKEYETAD
jgi:hypothetical protein